MANLFRKLPKVDILMKDEKFSEIKNRLSYNEFYNLVTEEIENFRNLIKEHKIDDFEISDIVQNILDRSKKFGVSHLRKVINGSGVIIHTNLGRSVLNTLALENLVNVASGYSNLELDLDTGKRGHRNSHVEELVCKITGSEGALVVNNNAAAVIICLNEFAKGKSAIVSRGELVEIGGSFRVPNIMELSGVKLKEVGTTNKTHLFDYENAIDEETGLILKIHRSNFKISGFTEEVAISDIGKLGKDKNILTMEDLGSGVLVDFSKYGVRKEPTVQESVASGVDVITISGDKLLGGPQCGIILASKENIARLKKNQYLRAFRVDKLVLSTLESTLKLYLDEKEAVSQIPTLRMITENPNLVLERARKLKDMFLDRGIPVEIVKTRAKIGGGSMPEETVASYGVRFEGNPNTLEENFRCGNIAIIGRIYENSYIIDMKTVDEREMEDIVSRYLEFGR